MEIGSEVRADREPEKFVDKKKMKNKGNERNILRVRGD
jgi:hypothetical protein